MVPVYSRGRVYVNEMNFPGSLAFLEEAIKFWKMIRDVTRILDFCILNCRRDNLQKLVDGFRWNFLFG